MEDFFENIKQYDEELETLYQNELEYKNAIENIKKNRDNCSQKRRNAVLFLYLNPEKRENLIAQATSLGYSADKIKQISDYFNHWTIDIITEDVIDLLREVNTFIDSYINQLTANDEKKKQNKKRTSIIDFLCNDRSN